MFSICLVVLVSLELCNSIEVPQLLNHLMPMYHSTAVFLDWQSHRTSLARPVATTFGLDLLRRDTRIV